MSTCLSHQKYGHHSNDAEDNYQEEDGGLSTSQDDSAALRLRLKVFQRCSKGVHATHILVTNALLPEAGAGGS